jgi:hypothetical protein
MPSYGAEIFRQCSARDAQLGERDTLLHVVAGVLC